MPSPLSNPPPNPPSNPLVELEIEGAVARLRLNRPPLHILSIAMRHELNAALDTIAANDRLRVAVIESTGERAFSVGSDLKEFPQDEAGGRAKIEFEQRQLTRIERLPLITITRLHGYVLGGGAELMLCTDFRLASDDVTIGFPEIRVGGFPAAGGVWRLTRDIGPARARQMLLLGESISAATALAWGLIQECLPATELDARVEALAAELLALPHAALLAIKRGVANAAASARTEALDDAATHEYGRLYRGRDIFEGLAGFIEKRPPRYNREEKDARS